MIPRDESRTTAPVSHGEAVYRRLKTELVHQDIPPGARILEIDIAERMDVSRTPVREALRRLESDGFVQRIGKSRLVATPAGPDDLGDIGLLRVELDGLAARLMARRATLRDWADLENLAARIGESDDNVSEAHIQFHRGIYAVGFGPRMSIFVDNHILPFLDVAVNPGNGETNAVASCHTHRKLLAALSRGDPDRAAAAARNHAVGGLKAARRPRS